MCGIAGVLDLFDRMPVDEDLVARMVAVLRHRGPDETGIYLEERVGLGQARLSIIDIAGGMQPLSNEDGSLWIVFNGEIFNYVELKRDLMGQGHVFSTESDTEVILHLYEEHGERCLERMNGQFAFALWDARCGELFLARDRMGVRPLYYCTVAGRLLFASEIKAIMQDPAVPRELDPEALLQVFSLWSTVPPRTAFAGIHELPAGHWMRIRNGKTVQASYWCIPYASSEDRWRGSLGEAMEALKELLSDAVRIRLRSDVPVGAYLSGGLDSSILTTLMACQAPGRLRTFSLGFAEQRYDETPFQDELIRQLGTEHSRVTVENDQIGRLLPDVVWHCETPLLRTAPVPMATISRLVRESGYKVVLTGEGADEIFGGYNIFKEAKIRHFWGREPASRLRPLLLERLYPYVFSNPGRGRQFLQGFFAVSPEDLSDPYLSHRVRWKNGLRNTTFFSEQLHYHLTGYDPLDEVAKRMPSDFTSRDPLAQAQTLEMGIFLASYLLSSQGDRVAMAHSVELRHPFLDYRVVDFASRLPPAWKIRGLREKYILKKAFADMLPAAILSRNKQPYRAPIREVFFGAGTRGPDYVSDLLSESNLVRTGWFNPAKVGHLVAKYRSDVSSAPPSEVQDMALVGILTTLLLHRQFVESSPRSGVRPVRADRVVRSARRTADSSPLCCPPGHGVIKG